MFGGGDTREEVGVAAVPIARSAYREESAGGRLDALKQGGVCIKFRN
jgi:hypothetical protein